MAGISRVMTPWERHLEFEIQTAYCRDVGFDVWKIQYQRLWFAKMKIFDRITKDIEAANDWTEYYYEQLFARRELGLSLYTQYSDIVTDMFLIMTN